MNGLMEEKYAFSVCTIFNVTSYIVLFAWHTNVVKN